MSYHIRVRPTAIVIQEERILLVEYSDENGIHYNLPGGGAEPGETITDGVLRELYEETTTQLLPVQSPLYTNTPRIIIPVIIRRISTRYTLSWNATHRLVLWPGCLIFPILTNRPYGGSPFHNWMTSCCIPTSNNILRNTQGNVKILI